MSSVAGIFDAEFEWRKEIEVDAEGKGWLSRTAIARLAGVNLNAVQYQLQKITESDPANNRLTHP